MDPREPLGDIFKKYQTESKIKGFDLKKFVAEHFEPLVPPLVANLESAATAEAHIQQLWPALRRSDKQEQKEGSTKIPLPYPYIVPGGRFGEIYYWDSFFTMQGLPDIADVASMVQNFIWLIKNYGHIPNGNRTYFLSRSQPPFFGSMLDYYAQRTGEPLSSEAIAALRLEMNYWCHGEEGIKSGETSSEHLVSIDGGVMFRYFDREPCPRPESYAEDVALTKTLPKGSSMAVFHHLRAACESGWDFSSRWMYENGDLGTIHCGHILPCDLNALMIFNFDLLYRETGETVWLEKKELLTELYMKWLWSDADGFFCDYDLVRQRSTGKATAAMMYPLFLGVATPPQAAATADFVREHLLKPGGIVTTLQDTGEQWDWPNGWAPLQFVAVEGLKKYGHTDLAQEIAQRWTNTVDEVFARTGKVMEKYNVVQPDIPGGGGEYPNQDGFGWTNGVYMAFKQWLNTLA